MFARVVFLALCGLSEAHQLARDASNNAVQLQQEELVAREAFQDAVPFVNALLQDVAKIQQSLRRADASLVQVSSRTTKPATPAVTVKKTSILSGGKKAFDTGAALKKMDKLGPNQMPAMLSVVANFYDAWKAKIAHANQHDKDGKKRYDVNIAELEARKRKYKSDANATKAYDSIEHYWRRQRELSRKQYHTSLKIMHSGMAKFKTMMGAMQAAIASKAPTAAQKTAMSKVAPEPEVVFLQKKVKDLNVWAKGAVSLLRDSLNTRPGMACVSSGTSQ